jgi:hypothetical protein
MKNREFINNKVVERIVKTNMEKATFLPFTHVSQPSFETNGYWIVRIKRLGM